MDTLKFQASTPHHRPNILLSTRAPRLRLEGLTLSTTRENRAWLGTVAWFPPLRVLHGSFGSARRERLPKVFWWTVIHESEKLNHALRLCVILSTDFDLNRRLVLSTTWCLQFSLFLLSNLYFWMRAVVIDSRYFSPPPTSHKGTFRKLLSVKAN